MSHSKVEQLFHPDNFKNKFCLSTFNPKMKCEYGDFCCHAHKEQELQIDLIHKMEKDLDFYLFYFKTEMCPYIFDTKRDHDDCPYAHSAEEKRRKPHLIKYGHVMCKDYSYSGHCANEDKCPLAHGYYESEYHPDKYRT